MNVVRGFLYDATFDPANFPLEVKKLVKVDNLSDWSRQQALSDHSIGRYYSFAQCLGAEPVQNIP